MTRSRRLREAAHRWVWVQPIEQFLYGVRLSWQQEVWRYFAKRLQHKPSLMCPRMGQREMLALALIGSKKDEVQVEWPRFVENLLWTTPKLLLKELKL